MSLSVDIIVGLDLETTGVDIAVDEPVQMAAIYVTLKAGVASVPKVLFNGYCNPSVPIHPEAQEIHGISPEMVRYSPTPKIAAVTMAMLIESAKNQGVLYTLGYNSGPFDIPILARYDKRFTQHKHIDLYTLTLRELHIHGTKLTDLYRVYCGKDPDNAHDAAADIFFTIEVLLKYLEESGKTVQALFEELSIPMVYTVFPFGKYKGKAVAVVPPSYAKWCLKNFDNIAPDLQMTLDFIAGGHK